MTLDQYLTANDISINAFAETCGTSGASMNRIVHGEQKPSVDMIRAIVGATDGAVTADDLIFGEPRPRKERAA
jgi:transcriptional regulator with XRE-family HTH domain